MKAFVMGVLVCMWVVAALPATAQNIDETQATADIQIADDIQIVDEKVRVVTELGQQDECLAPLTVNKIDGVKQTMSAVGFLIEPGVHTINGRALLDTTKCRPLDDIQYIARADDLEVEFEAGKIYYVAYDRSHRDVDEWKLVVWKVELVPGYLTEDQNQRPDEY